MCLITGALPQTGDGTLYIQYRHPVTFFKFFKKFELLNTYTPQWFQTKDCVPVKHSMWNQMYTINVNLIELNR